ncbi:MAG TPA: TIGR03668 family PPOX class F420-dependent oxidoreductase [Gammaproteobacteria bacterium]|nr:TIGR03668 family PPOX class F420-dependent oxidoreductase [Gammaproteobacteria bacterium]
MEPWLVELIDSADVARFATTDGIQPHLVPVVLVSEGNHIYLPIDGKLKKPGRLKRMSNIELHPEVALLVDHYEEDWSQLWWVRIDAMASIVPLPTAARNKFTEKYSGYGHTEIGNESIKLEVVNVQKWSNSAE